MTDRRQRRAARRHARQLREQRRLVVVGVLALAVAGLGTALLVRFEQTLFALPPIAPRPARVVVDACSPAELVSLDSWTLARVERAPIAAPNKQRWEAEQAGAAKVAAALRARLRAWPRHLLAAPQKLPRDPAGFARRLAADTWRGLDAFTDTPSGLPLDTVTLGAAKKGAPAAVHVGDYTNVTDIGLYLAAVVGAFELRLIDEETAKQRINRILATLDSLETDDGFYFNYYDTTSLERTSHFVSFVDSAWLTAGLMVVRMTFPSLYERCTSMIEQTDYGVMYDPGVGLMSHGYYLEPRARSRYHYGVLYTEARLGALIAIGKGDAPEELWFNMARTFPPQCAWQSRPPQDITTREVRGHVVTAGTYRWRGLRYVPSWGGSMFEALMPTILLDERAAAPRSLGLNGLMHAVGQRRFARRELNLPVWGLSPSARPGGDGYGEFGVKPLGSLGYGPGPVTPHASALALAGIPQAALANLQSLARRYDVYGDYGFYDAVDPRSGEVATKYLALDQSMLFLALVNHLTDHALQRRFASDPIMRRALPVIAGEDFFPPRAGEKSPAADVHPPASVVPSAASPDS
ncbi:MAG: glucoamylase family protein [bacterium]